MRTGTQTQTSITSTTTEKATTTLPKERHKRLLAYHVYQNGASWDTFELGDDAESDVSCGICGCVLPAGHKDVCRMPEPFGKRLSRARRMSLQDPDPDSTSIIINRVVAERVITPPALPSPVSVVALADEEDSSPPKRPRVAAPVDALEEAEVDAGAVTDDAPDVDEDNNAAEIESASKNLTRVRAACATLLAEMQSAMDQFNHAIDGRVRVDGA